MAAFTAVVPAAEVSSGAANTSQSVGAVEAGSGAQVPITFETSGDTGAASSAAALLAGIWKTPVDALASLVTKRVSVNGPVVHVLVQASIQVPGVLPGHWRRYSP